MSPIDIYGVALAVIQILEKLGVVYELGGSLASSLHGTPRSTLDADIVADLRPSQVPGFIEALGSDYYAVPDAIRESILRRRSFNIIHTATALKIDIFPIKDNPFSITEFSRRRQASFPPPSGPQVWVCSPEDIIPHNCAGISTAAASSIDSSKTPLVCFVCLA